MNCHDSKVPRKKPLGGSGQSGSASWGRWPQCGEWMLRFRLTGAVWKKGGWQGCVSPFTNRDLYAFHRRRKGNHKTIKKRKWNKINGPFECLRCYLKILFMNRADVSWACPAPAALTHAVCFDHHYNLSWRSCSHFTGEQWRITETKHHGVHEDERQNAAWSVGLPCLCSFYSFWKSSVLSTPALLLQTAILFPCHCHWATASCNTTRKITPDSY